MRWSPLCTYLGALLFACSGCAKTKPGSDMSSATDHDAGVPRAGTASPAPAAGSGGHHSPTAGHPAPSAGHVAPAAGSGGSNAGTGAVSPDGTCSKDVAIPSICKLCADNSCGSPVCKDGKFTGEFVCPSPGPVDCGCVRGADRPVCGADGKTYDASCDRSCVPVTIACDGACPCPNNSGACVVGGCSGQMCTDATQPRGSTCEWRDEYACYRTATCERQSTGQCGWTQTPALQACLKNPKGSGNLHWYMSCGDPVCRVDDKPFDDPNIANCTTQKLGDTCTTEGDLCDGVASCGAKLICAASDPTQKPGGCPISRARFKEQVEYLTTEQRRNYRDQLMSLPLASYRYKHAPEAGPQLGFMIDDVEPSVAVSGDHVNMYGYLSMAVAAIQEQQRQIAQLERELAEVRAHVATAPAAASCEP